MSEFNQTGDSPIMHRKPVPYYRLNSDAPEAYTSMYGYRKYRIWVDQVTETGSLMQSKIGWIKQEPLIGPNGDVVGSIYYERNGWRKSGHPRFFSTPEALMEAAGMALYVSLAEAMAAAAQVAPADVVIPVVVMDTVTDMIADGGDIGGFKSIDEVVGGLQDAVSELMAPTMADMQGMTDEVTSNPEKLDTFMLDNPLPGDDTQAAEVAAAIDADALASIPGIHDNEDDDDNA